MRGAEPPHYLKLHSRCFSFISSANIKSLGIIFHYFAGFPYDRIVQQKLHLLLGCRRGTSIMAHERAKCFILLFAFTSALVQLTNSAPVGGEDGSHEGGCYHMLEYYNHGDQIRTSEPCLNCTCNNNTLRCFLKTCPYTKPIGLDCIVERSENVCCPTIRCPQVPVMIPASEQPQTIEHFTESPEEEEEGDYESEGCVFEGVHYTDGAQVPSSSRQPCELCYCIRNRTACVFQDCILNVSGCSPQFKPGVCCPVSYNCDDQSPTTTTTTTTKPSEVCLFEGVSYENGATIPSSNKCQNCYCLRGSVTCAVHDCTPPSKDCVAVASTEDSCCPQKYDCPSKTNITHSVAGESPVAEEKEGVDETATIVGLGLAPADTAVSTNASEESGTTNRPATITHHIVASHIPVFVVSEAAATTPQVSPEDSDEDPKVETEEKEHGVTSETVAYTTTPKKQPELEDTTSHQQPVLDYTIVAEDVPDVPGTAAPSVDTQESREPSDVTQDLETQTKAQDPTLILTTTSILETEVADDRKDTTLYPEPEVAKTEAFFVTEELSVTESHKTTPAIETKTTTSGILEPETEPKEPEGTPALPREEQPEGTPQVDTEVTHDKPEVIVTEAPVEPFVPVTEADFVPGEGDCLQDGITYKRHYSMPSADPCKVNCTCQSSLMVCEKVICANVLDQHVNDSCVQIYDDGSCCPRYICERIQHPTGITDIKNLIKSNETQVTEATIKEQVTLSDRIDTTHLPITEAVTHRQPVIHVVDTVTVIVEQPEQIPTTGIPSVEEYPLQDVSVVTKSPETPDVTPDVTFTTRAQHSSTESVVEQEPEVVFTLQEEEPTVPAIPEEEVKEKTEEEEAARTESATSSPLVVTTQMEEQPEGGDILIVAPEQETTESPKVDTETSFPEVRPDEQEITTSLNEIERNASHADTTTPDFKPHLVEGTTSPSVIRETSVAERESPALESSTQPPSEPEQETLAPEYETQAPEQQTPAPELETPAPEGKTPVPEQATSAPELETSAPKEDMPASEQGTLAPEQETLSPEREATVPQDVTTAPELETSAPELETSAPKHETPTPEQGTSAPEQGTTAPEQGTPAPEQETPTPEREGPAPQDVTSAPELETSAPEQETSAPERETSAPELETSAPKHETTPEQATSAPEQATSAPELGTSAPELETSAPELGTSAPELETSAPELGTSAPELETSAPELEASAPKQGTLAPESGTSAPELETSAPETGTSAPEQEQPIPEIETSAPDAETRISTPVFPSGTSAPETKATATTESEPSIAEVVTLVTEAETSVPDVESVDGDKKTFTIIPESSTPQSKPSIHENETLPESLTSAPAIDESKTPVPSFPESETSAPETTKSSLPETETPPPAAESKTSVPDSPMSTDEAVTSVPEVPEVETPGPEKETPIHIETVAPETDDVTHQQGDSPLPDDERHVLSNETRSPEYETSTVSSSTLVLTDEKFPVTAIPGNETAFQQSDASTQEGTTRAAATDIIVPEVTLIPEIKTPVPKIETVVPEVVTPVPEIVTQAPEIVTPVPEIATPAHEIITLVPDVVTPVPEVVTQVPEIVTQVPEIITPVPEIATPAPEIITPVPEVVTLVPDIVTPVPEIVTAVPKIDTSSPEIESTVPTLAITVPHKETSSPALPSETRAPEAAIHDIPFPQSTQPETATSYSSPEPVTATVSATLKPLTTTLDPHDYDENQFDHDYPGSADFGVPIPSENFTLQEGDCIYDGLLYVSAQQIPRDDACDFCFCFRGDIICLKQSCPPPIEECFQESIPGFCCPRFECPVTALTLNLTDSRIPYPMSSHYGRYRSARAVSQKEVVVCAFGHNFYNEGEFIRAASGPCMDCVCGSKGTMSCMPKTCEPASLWQTLQGLKQTPVRTKKAYHGSSYSWH